MICSGVVVSVVKLSKNTVFVSHVNGYSNDDLYGVLCTINDTTITVDTEMKLSNADLSQVRMSAILSNEDTIFIASGNQNDASIRGTIVNCNKEVYPLQTGDIFGVAKTSGTSGQTVKVYVPDYN